MRAYHLYITCICGDIKLQTQGPVNLKVRNSDISVLGVQHRCEFAIMDLVPIKRLQ